ncbi:alanine racemase [Arcanobacterium haemolyticum]|nr:alanine racemase [Arcanobacterium haemolyticum]
MHSYYPARADIDLDAVGHNISTIRSGIDGQKIMAIVKADAYGHGILHVARAALRAGADFLGVAQLGEALHLRRLIGPKPRILTWIYAPGAPLDEAITNDIDVAVGAFWALDDLAAAARKLGRTARVHLKVDTGMARGGFNLSDVPEAARRARALEKDSLLRVVGLFSHLARADEPEADTTNIQIGRFEQARTDAAHAGLDIELHHLAASAGALWHPRSRFDMVRPGIVLYGLSPNPAIATASELGLRAAMTLSADIIVVRDVPEGTGVSYGHTATTTAPAHLGVVPLGYGDGIDRAASNKAPLVINGERTQILGRVCMDQFVVELPAQAESGNRAWLFGDASAGLPTADDWAEAVGTIGWEIVTRLGSRVPRYYHGTGGMNGAA